MTQAAAAKVMNVSRARLNQMLRGKVEGVTFDRILQMADAIDAKGEVNYKQAAVQGRLILTADPPPSEVVGASSDGVCEPRSASGTKLGPFWVHASRLQRQRSAQALIENERSNLPELDSAEFRMLGVDHDAALQTVHRAWHSNRE